MKREVHTTVALGLCQTFRQRAPQSKAGVHLDLINDRRGAAKGSGQRTGGESFVITKAWAFRSDMNMAVNGTRDHQVARSVHLCSAA